MKIVMRKGIQFACENARKRKYSPDGKVISRDASNCAAKAGPPKAGGSLGINRLKVPPRRSSSSLLSLSCKVTVPGALGGFTATTYPESIPRTGGRLSGGFVPPPVNVICTFNESSFQLEKRFNASSRDTIVFLMIASQFSFDFAAQLAQNLGWILSPPLEKLRSMWERYARKAK